jgi:hypothetical protein
LRSTVTSFPTPLPTIQVQARLSLTSQRLSSIIAISTRAGAGADTSASMVGENAYTKVAALHLSSNSVSPSPKYYSMRSPEYTSYVEV